MKTIKNRAFATLVILILTISMCACSKVDHSSKSVIKVKVVDKMEDNDIGEGFENRYIIKVEYNDTQYIMRNETAYNTIKTGEYIDVIYITNYDKNDNIIGVELEWVEEN